MGVGHSAGIVKTWGVDERNQAAITCGPVMDTDLRRLRRESVSDFDSFVTGDVLDQLFVK